MPHHNLFFFALDFEIMQIDVARVLFLNYQICDLAPPCGAIRCYALLNKYVFSSV